jgi:hypothetical protein
MRYLSISIVLLATAFSIACSKSTPTPTNPSVTSAPVVTTPSVAVAAAPASPAAVTATQPLKAKTDACALLSSNDLKSIQGEPIKETKLTARADGGFAISQCFYTLPTFTNSISLAVTERSDESGARDPREFWKETFHEDAEDGEREREKERERERASAGAREEEEEEGVPPQRVKGVGDEAYWMTSRVGGALYVLKGNSYVRLSIGGTSNEAARIKKLKALAQKIIVRI